LIRKNLVGTIFKGFDPPVLLTKFMGEGAESVVYEIAPPDNPEDNNRVIKFPKAAFWLEMDTLNYMFEVDEERYPDHPLRMSASERMEELSREMLNMATNDHLILRVKQYMKLLDLGFDTLFFQFQSVDDVGDPPENLFNGSQLRPWIDSNMAYRVRELLEEEQIVEESRDLVESFVEAIEDWIIQKQEQHSYSPLSGDPFFNLIGLHSIGFINEDELFHISTHQTIAPMIRAEHLDRIEYLMNLLHNCALAYPEESGGPYNLTLTSCALYLHLLELPQLKKDLARVAIGRLWQGRTLSRMGRVTEARTVLDSALVALDQAGIEGCRSNIIEEQSQLGNG
jgi:hypothetical protein